MFIQYKCLNIRQIRDSPAHTCADFLSLFNLNTYKIVCTKYSTLYILYVINKTKANLKIKKAKIIKTQTHAI